jgi:glutamate dehydrogenase (NADP+)/cyclic pyranopterin phosphate synthase/molybdopterin-guanine dinucleotide biosynthesis protein A
MTDSSDSRTYDPGYGAPVLAVCGFSGSGKTTLLEAVIPKLVARGLAVAVVKHDAHGFKIDQPGKDSDRLFRAGATVALRGPEEQFHRRAAAVGLALETTLALFGRDHDLLLVEGHKQTPLPKLWIGSDGELAPPSYATDVRAFLPWNSDRPTALLDFVDKWFPQAWRDRPLHAGLLIGGASSRMGRPKQMIEFEGATLAEIAVRALSAGMGQGPEQSDPPGAERIVLLGAGPIPESLAGMGRLPDPPGLAGPVAGLIAAHRWAPYAAWMSAACDHPALAPAHVGWLRSQRRPGVWAVIPRQSDGQPCPTLALYEPQALARLETLLLTDPRGARMAALLEHQRTSSPDVPPELASGWQNVNTPQELAAATEPKA